MWDHLEYRFDPTHMLSVNDSTAVAEQSGCMQLWLFYRRIANDYAQYYPQQYDYSVGINRTTVMFTK